MVGTYIMYSIAKYMKLYRLKPIKGVSMASFSRVSSFYALALGAYYNIIRVTLCNILVYVYCKHVTGI